MRATQTRFVDPSARRSRTITIVTRQVPDRDGTEVVVECHNAPSGISLEDHAAVIASSLNNHVTFVE
ncbi:hypothetical protein C9I57_31720 [Trinickia symbiotica]|uniref:Uncharacterized protein n=1 Tax=Trinickia symbiotica TaxID=863227 RepID=A0A2T3XJR5_9BURK|nr:hypothetical protein C9I57_31720 [Trinickia symbiotica]